MNTSAELNEHLNKKDCKLLTLPVLLLDSDNEMSEGKGVKRVVSSEIHNTDVFLINRPFKPLYKVV
jgi:hypothetical protein